ncbi:MAG TPA: hypothetical protein DCZ10_08810 [Pelotomaculum sp.]|nr:hypothetical protein [Pelotomaculum sp.]
MQLQKLELRTKRRKIVTCLMTFIMFSLLWMAQPGPAGATDQSNDGYPASEQLEIWVGYNDDRNKTYTHLKTFQQSELEKMRQRHVYTFIDNLPCTIVDPAEGVELTDILDACGIDVDDVKNFRFWTSDVPNTPYQTLTKAFLLDTPKYYFPCITDNWELVEGGFYDPTAGYSGSSDIYFPDSVAAAAYAVEVPPMLAFRDRWQRVFSGESGDTSFSNLVDAVRYRLVFGHPGNLGSAHPEHTASRSAKWIYRMDVTLNGSPQAVTKVTLDKTTATIKVGSTAQLTATISPSKAANKNVTWSSSDTAVATVSDTGLVTAVAPGTATVTVTTADGGKTATCVVTVQAATAAATGVSLNKTTATFDPGATEQLLATVTPGTADQSVTWKTSDSRVATVNSVGLVTAVAPGTANITVTTKDGGFTATCAVTVKGESAPVVQNPAGDLQDISGHWAESNIKELVARGVVSGYPDGTFLPDNTITRAEFSVILVKAFGLTLQDGKVFADTSGHWAEEYIATTTAYGIVSGYDDSSFGPDDPITREQMAVMLVKALKLSPAEGDSQTQFADRDSISDWAMDAVAIATQEGIMTGYPDNTFAPQGSATRAEAVTAIISALNNKNN